MKKLLSLIFIVITALSLSSNSFSQCRSFAKKKCMPELSPYIHNGQLNSTTLWQGDNAKIMLTFYSGQEYRLMVCGHKHIEDIYFTVKDADNSPIYSSKGKDKSYWDFQVGATQQLIVEVTVPDAKENKEPVNGCAAILVGFRD